MLQDRSKPSKTTSQNWPVKPINNTSTKGGVMLGSKRIGKFTTLMAIIGMAAAFFATSANADTVPGTVTVTSPTIVSSSAATSTVTGVAAASTSASVQGEFISSTGYHPSKPAAKYTHYIKAGTYYTNSYRNRNGTIVKFSDECGGSSKYTHPLTSGSHRGYCVFYYDTKLHVWRKPDCGNYVWFPSKPSKKIVTNLVLYKSFANISWKAALKLSESGKVAATATCSTPNSSSSATSSATVSVTITASVTVSAKYSTTAKVTAGKITSSQKSSLASALKIAATAKISATAKATCSYTPQTPPPPAQQSPSVSIGQKNDVDTSDTATVCADYNVPGSDQGTLTFSSLYGSYPGGKTFTVSGSGTQCTTYQAPSEVPPGGKDTLTVSLHDNTTGLSDDTPSDNSTPITINPAVTPL